MELKGDLATIENMQKATDLAVACAQFYSQTHTLTVNQPPNERGVILDLVHNQDLKNMQTKPIVLTAGSLHS